MDSDYWVVTKALLQADEDSLFKKPRLTEALLKRPPFRFLYDIFMTVERRTGLFGGSFTEEEMDFKAIGQNKKARVRFLEKVVSGISSAVGYDIAVDPYKVLAGLEPERTNELLQAIGRVARSVHEGDAPHVYSAECRSGSRRPGSNTGLVSAPQADVLVIDKGELTERPLHPEEDVEVEDTESDKSDDCGSTLSGKSSSNLDYGEKEERRVSRCSRQASRAEKPKSFRSRAPSKRRSSAHIRSDSSDSVAEYISNPIYTDQPQEESLKNDLQQEMVPVVLGTKGIILERKSFKETPPRTDDLDLDNLQKSVEHLRGLVSKLGDCLVHLLEAAGPMQTELDFWEREAAVWSEKLNQVGVSESEVVRNQDCSEALSVEIDDTKFRIRQLKDSIKNNEYKLIDIFQSLI